MLEVGPEMALALALDVAARVAGVEDGAEGAIVAKDGAGIGRNREEGALGPCGCHFSRASFHFHLVRH